MKYSFSFLIMFYFLVSFTLTLNPDESNDNVSLSDSVLNDETDEEIILFKEKFNLKKNTNGYVTSEELAIINASDQIHTDKSNNNVSLSDSVLNEETVNELKCQFNLKKDTNDHVTLGELIEIINSFDQLEIDEDDVQFYVKTLEYNGIIDVRIVGNLAKSTKRKFSRTLKIKIKKALENNNGKLKFSDFANLMHALYTMINK
ncbi:uncharacterized protein LOC126899893 isoform X6 [Daktulosphaira vitifoliae]|uniref:uncharacterized protein LOC126899893 isoform X6 n=1 Tax=Daktulosphaira vitifoliae TaxID=58002 RepID=UPI0021AA7E83|nr:uncharacterized protein LOC126899893 isoform X6 [Daktulosphaira vitifoliae]